MEIILDRDQMKRADERTSELMHVPSAVLMERAALCVVETAFDIIRDEKMVRPKILIVSGSGNNGGDGFAAGRIFMEKNMDVDFCLLGEESKASFLLAEQIASVRALDENLNIYSELPDKEYDIIIDAIFGISLNREVRGIYADAINKINELKCKGAKVISVDIASGVDADSGSVLGTAVHADYTVACAFGKFGHFLYPGAGMTGKVIRAEIGITPKALEKAPSVFAPELKDMEIPKRVSDSNKGTYGKLLLIAGSAEMCGAALLSAEAALRLGCGMVKIFTHENNRTAIQTSLPEALISTYSGSELNFDRLKKDLEWCNSLVVGPGLGTDETAFKLLSFSISKANVPMVLDADALNIIAKRPELLKFLPEREKSCGKAIITPHMGEMSRLKGLPISEIKLNRLDTARKYSAENDLICVLKDAVTITALPDGRAFFNTSGNSGMSTAGSGDVLAGMAGSLLAQGTEPEKAAWMAVYLHGAAGDIAKEKLSAHSMLASDIIASISDLILKLGGNAGYAKV